MKRVLIIDTGILCVWLDVPNMDTCGPENDSWDKQRVDAKIIEAMENKTTFVLPLATIIETGNHIAHATHSRRERGMALAELIQKSADSKTPWAAFSDQSILWTSEKLKKLAQEWPGLAAEKISIGDATIKDVAEYYAQTGCHVEILTGDLGLKAYEPISPVPEPRRRKRQKGAN